MGNRKSSPAQKILGSMSALTPYLPWLAWAVLPSLATDFTLKLLYGSSLLTRPQTPNVAIKQSSRVRALLVAGFLAWSFYSSIASREPSAYELLGLGLDSSVDQVKKAFRRMAVIHHPDKVGAQGEGFFIALRRSHDVLSDPVKRFAYDRLVIECVNEERPLESAYPFDTLAAQIWHECPPLEGCTFISRTHGGGPAKHAHVLHRQPDHLRRHLLAFIGPFCVFVLAFHAPLYTRDHRGLHHHPAKSASPLGALDASPYRTRHGSDAASDVHLLDHGSQAIAAVFIVSG